MNNTNKARTIKVSTEKKLFALSRNQCYHPNCTKQLISDDRQDVLAKIAHIEAASENGPRFNSDMTDDERRDFNNLILLCDEHHIEIDSHPNEYPTSMLKEWKLLHEGIDKDFLFLHTLQEKYLNDFKTINLLLNNTPKPIDEIFVNLAIIKEEKEEKANNEYKREALLSSYEEIHKPKEPIEIKELINTSKKSLIYGKAGVGKTTLCKYLAYKWANKELYSEFEYVIYISLREWKTKGLKGAIKDNYYSQDNEDIALDIKENSQKILFLFDGYDELAEEKKRDLQKEIEVYGLTHYIITSRPYGYQRNDFRVDEHFETIGFTDEDAEEYIENFFDNKEKQQALKEFLESNIGIKHIAYIPLMLEMICSLWEEESFSDSLTMTELYSQVVENILNKYSALKDDDKVYKRKNRKKIKEYLGKIAFEGLTQQSIFFDGDLIEEAIEDIDFFEENVIYSGFLKSSREEKDLLDNNFEFPHLTFQEYFSALYVASLSPKEQSEIIRDWKLYPHMQMFFAFLGGLIRDKEFLLREIESEPRDLVGFYEFELSLICIGQVREVTKKIKNKMFFKFIYWLNFIIRYKLDYEVILDKLKLFLYLIDEDFFNILLKLIKNEKLDKYIRVEVSDKIVFLSSNNKKLIEKIVKIVKDEKVEAYSRAILAQSLSINQNIKLDWLDDYIWDEFNMNYDIDTFDYLDTCMDKLSDENDKNMELFEKIYENKATKKEIIEYFIKYEDLHILFEKYNKEESFLEILLRNSFYNLKPLYLKNKKLHTIENGKEISIEREVDEKTLAEIQTLISPTRTHP